MEASRFAIPMRGPSRSRTRSKVARWLTAATRPDISAKTQMPTTPTMTTQPRERPNRAPTCALVTRSPMSTKPPIAVRMPRATSKTFFTASSPAHSASLLRLRWVLQIVLELFQRVGRLLQPVGQGVVPVAVAVDHRDARGRHQARRLVDLARDRLVALLLRSGRLPGPDGVTGLAD